MIRTEYPSGEVWAQEYLFAESTHQVDQVNEPMLLKRAAASKASTGMQKKGCTWNTQIVGTYTKPLW